MMASLIEERIGVVAFAATEAGWRNGPAPARRSRRRRKGEERDHGTRDGFVAFGGSVVIRHGSTVETEASMNRIVRLAAVLTIIFGMTAAFGARALGQGSVNRGDLRFVVVTHGQAADPFWSVVQNGVSQAAEDMGVQVEYQAPDTFDIVQMAQSIDAAVASDPDGLVVSIPDADALGESIQAAVDAGIPVISIKSGADVAAELGVLTHIGQTEYEAGVGGGQRMGEAGVTNAICINQEVGNVALDERCRGFADGLAESGGTSEVVETNLNDPTESQSRIEAAISANPDINGILALGPTASAPALEALRAADQLGTIQLATFDLSPDVLQAIADGDMLFAIDQQQYLQGYLPIVLLTLYATNLNTIANPVLMTGPGFVTQENAERIIELSAAGTR
jgi:simple sugar transport system substrate-binding protein